MMSDDLSRRINAAVYIFGGTPQGDFLVAVRDEIERILAREALLRRIIYDLLDDGDETDRTAARAALEDSYF